ncbi:hypothetical protein BN2497_5223 [Janthinobacterium sp. CG23_2]|nr:hypothetical protein BN2497_5223 [Janthinobacterium sp. CG23_2]CUU29009.1 hypothetical protein BN3177_5223 [Janthinobacterium sp. CG23_2]
MPHPDPPGWRFQVGDGAGRHGRGAGKRSGTSQDDSGE